MRDQSRQRRSIWLLLGLSWLLAAAPAEAQLLPESEPASRPPESVSAAASDDLTAAWERFANYTRFDTVLASYSVLNLIPPDGATAALCEEYAKELAWSRAVNPFSPALQTTAQQCAEASEDEELLASESERSQRLLAFLLAGGRGESAYQPLLVGAEADASMMIRLMGATPLYGRYVVGSPGGSLPFIAVYFDPEAKREKQLHFDFMRLWQRLQGGEGEELYPAMLRGLVERYLNEADQAANPRAELAKLTIELGREEISPATAAARIERLALEGSTAATFELLPLCLILDDQGVCAANALELVRPYAERGFAEAMVVMALAAEHRVEGAGDSSELKQWLQQAGERMGEPEALTAYAQLSISIDPGQQISAHAAKALRKAARADYAPATLLLVQMLRSDRLRRQRGDSADRWLRRAADAGSTAAMAQLGLEYLRLARFRDGWPLLEQAAAKNDPTAMGLLAIGHDAGRMGLAGDEERALSLYRAAAQLGNGGAMRRLGRAYARGELQLEPDLARAEAWYLSASLAGNQKAATDLADLYLSGAEGMVGQASDGYAVIEKLAADGMVAARLRLAVALLLGQGVEANPDLAMKMLRELSGDGNLAAEFRLGQIYEFGQGGVTPDLEVAREHYRSAARRGHPDAIDYYARALFAGRGGDRDRVEAVRWWSQAAAKGHGPSIANLSWARCSSSDPAVRDPVGGTRLVSEALQRKPSANLNDTLAACLAASGLFDQAVAAQQQTLDLADQDPRLGAEEKRAFAERLARYERREAWIED
ncbi:MAG: tetratricopeptide repeat protein [Lysobacterales bacterium]